MERTSLTHPLVIDSVETMTDHYEIRAAGFG